MTGFTRIITHYYLRRLRRSENSYQSSALPSSESGVTLLEALVAMIIITITVSMMTPPIFMAVATRVSNRRTEQAMQLAQGEIERVRLLMLGSESYAKISPELPPIDTAAKKDTIEQVGIPTSVCAAAPCTSLQLVPTSNPDFFYQTFREDGAEVASGDVVAFRMGVRVYSSEALDDNGSPRTTLRTDTGSLSFTTGSSRNERPLATFYTEMIRGTEGGGLAAMQDAAWD